MAHNRKAFNFDLDIKKLKQLYPSPSGSNTSYNNAWNQIQTFLQANGFEHRQYSGYETVRGMSYAEAYNVLENMQEKFPWFKDCAKVAVLTEIGKRHDVLEHLNRVKEVEAITGNDARTTPHITLRSESQTMRASSKALAEEEKSEHKTPNKDDER